MVTALSPLRKKHFVGEVVDEAKSIRFVGFDPSQRMQLDALNKSPVLLKNCDIQVNQYSKSLEVVIKGYTRITNCKSPQTFDIADPDMIGTTTIFLEDLYNMQE